MALTAYVRENGIELQSTDGISVFSVANQGVRYSERPLGIALPDDVQDCVEAALGKIRTVSLKGPDRSVNQDAAIAAVMTDPISGEVYHFAATADGLGSGGEAHFVERGARLAVLCALQVLHRSITGEDTELKATLRLIAQGVESEKATKGKLKRMLFPALEASFIDAVRADFAPIRSIFQMLPTPEKETGFYAATLNFTLVGPKGGLTFQLGDGGTANIDADGNVIDVRGLDDCGSPTKYLGFSRKGFESWFVGTGPLALKFPLSEAMFVPAKGQRIIVATDGMEKIVEGGAQNVVQSILDQEQSVRGSTLKDDTSFAVVSCPLDRRTPKPLPLYPVFPAAKI